MTIAQIDALHGGQQQLEAPRRPMKTLSMAEWAQRAVQN